MIYERRAILSLLAMGRITAADAERLMLIWRDTAWQQVSEWLLIAVACLAAATLQIHPHIHGFGNFAHAVVAHGTRALHTAVSIGFKRMGGSI